MLWPAWKFVLYLKLSMLENETFTVIATVKDAEKYLATGLMPDTTFNVTVQGFTASGSGPPSCKIAKTNKVPAVTGMLTVLLLR